MPLPPEFDPIKACPVDVPCFRCKNIYCKVTRAWHLLSTNVIEHLLVCQGCRWGTVIRYAADRPEKWIRASVVSPGKSAFGYVLPKAPKLKE
jgi:hypothetical protein